MYVCMMWESGSGYGSGLTCLAGRAKATPMAVRNQPMGVEPLIDSRPHVRTEDSGPSLPPTSLPRYVCTSLPRSLAPLRLQRPRSESDAVCAVVARMDCGAVVDNPYIQGPRQAHLVWLRVYHVFQMSCQLHDTARRAGAAPGLILSRVSTGNSDPAMARPDLGFLP